MKAIVGRGLLIGVVVVCGARAHAQDPTPPAADAVDAVSPPSGNDGISHGTPPDAAPILPPAALPAEVDRPPGFSVSDDALAAASAAGNPDAATSGAGKDGGVAWRSLLKQSFALLVVQQAYRAAFEDGTWAETKRGIFWDDYVASARTLCCWDDGDKFTTNKLFHPMLGSTSAFIFANNHAPSQRTPPGNTRRYWSNKTKAMAYAAVYSAYFEMGPVLSEAAIGNVGLTRGQQTWQDIVITPTVGTALSVGEDLLRVHVIDKVDRRSHALGIPLALLLNPTRSVANVFAGRLPWRAPPAWPRRSSVTR